MRQKDPGKGSACLCSVLQSSLGSGDSFCPLTLNWQCVSSRKLHCYASVLPHPNPLLWPGLYLLFCEVMNVRLDAFWGSPQLKYKLIFGMLEVPKTFVHPVAMGVFQSGKVSAVNFSHVFLQEILWLAQVSLSVYANRLMGLRIPSPIIYFSLPLMIGMSEVI